MFWEKKKNDYKVTADQLQKAITKNTKAILFSNPSNPTGSILDENELREIAQVIEKNPDIYVISDEIYEYINFGNIKPYSIGSIESIANRVVTTNGFSKAWAMTGWRLGYLCASPEIASAATKLLGQFASGSCGIVQMAGLEAITQGKAKVQYMVDEYKKRRDYIFERLEQIKGFDTCKPEGAFYMFPEVKSLYGKKYKNEIISNSNEFCKFLINEVGVALVPGIGFGCDDCVRISFGASMEDIKKGMDRIEKAVALLN